jgi:hypothetical protein
VARNISIGDIKRLLLESGGICAFPQCNRPLISPDSAIEDGAVLAELAHIVADSREGPRGKTPLSDEERNQHDNLIVLCPEHHTIVDSQPNTFSIEVLRQMKRDHLAAIRSKLHPDISVTPKISIAEKIQSSVLSVTHLPQAIYEAKCFYGPGQEEEVRTRISAPKGREVLLPYVLAHGKLFCFQDLQANNNPFSKVVDTATALARSAPILWNEDEGKRLYVRLLNRSLYKYAGHRSVRFDTLHRRFFFIPLEKGKSRSVRYKSLGGKNVQRKVVWQPIRKKTGEVSNTWWHVAAGLRFHQIDTRQWCLSIRPEWHLTKDSETPLEPKRIGRRVTSKKSRMFNYQYLREISFWRDFLADGKPRIVLNFDDQTAIIEARLLEFSIIWPGIPGDSVVFDSNAGDEDLFSLAEFQDALEGTEIDWDEDEEIETDAASEL